ncbi:Protein CBG02910 [Caenorhabditis briggsae]|uniref:Protein CBG02910 n=1 Tax=Caenorhabditis briggsae TaxID=6238 RepID=A8WT86_CAEBR|nr:Protein CBG02910 [Caenorhabditis briggsae]CAP23697.2 Protein CBG02910 [Caenorhabditis briggsae]
MSKQLVVNGRTILVEEQDVDEVCAMFKENIIIDSEEGWSNRFEVTQVAVFFCGFALHHSGLPWKRFDYLSDCWVKAERMHGDTYGRGNFSPSEYSSVISDVQTFVNEFSKIDRKKLWSEFTSLHVVNGCAQTFGFNVLKQWADDQETMGSLPKKTSKLEKDTKKQTAEIEKKVVEISNALKDLDVMKKVYTKFVDGKTVESRSSRDNLCVTDICLFRDKEACQLVNKTTVDCNGCAGRAHAVCCGIWTEDEYLITLDQSVVAQCWSCEGLGVSEILLFCEQQTTDLKNVHNQLTESLKFVTQYLYVIACIDFRDVIETADYRANFWKGNGSLRKESEHRWRRNGADISAIFGKETEVSEKNRSTDGEEMELILNLCWEHLQVFAGDMNMTPKCHILLDFMPYARRFGTLGRMSEQSIESFHALFNRLQDRFKTVRNDVTRYTHCFRVLLFFNHVFMNS